ncbi:MAG: transrane protein, partial [Alphaproteobacteria bacterium]|nr:transrane protein [Alphaproteobacteria bacterium]
FSGLVYWALAGVFIVGGVVGGFVGALLAKHLSGTQGRLTTVFAALIFVVAAYMLWKSAAAL